MVRRVALVRTEVSEESVASMIRVSRIGVLGTKLAVISKPSTLRFLQEPYAVTSKKTAIFRVYLIYFSTSVHEVPRLSLQKFANTLHIPKR
jgi:hypothetical protein